jgi:hypothetical protein
MADAIRRRDEAVSEYLHIHKDLQIARHDLAAVQVEVLGKIYNKLIPRVALSFVWIWLG